METAFLHGVLEEEIFMKLSEGSSYKKDKCLKLKKCIYGLVQAARQWWITFTEYLVNELGFEESKADACLFIKFTKTGAIIIAVYVDDVFLVGDEESVDKGITMNLLEKNYCSYHFLF